MSDPAARAGDAPPVDFGDALAVVGFGGGLLDDTLDARLSGALDPADAAALVARLEELRRAMQADDPRRARRSAGLFARLTGRDVRDEDEALRLRDRLGVLLSAADGSAAALRARALLQQSLAAQVEAARQRLDAAVAGARTWLAAHPEAGRDAGEPGATASRAAFERRLDQLATVAAAWDLGARQLALLREQILDLLARYQRIRDVLLPAWRQQALADAAQAGAQHARAAADTYAAIASEVEAMAGTLD